MVDPFHADEASEIILYPPPNLAGVNLEFRNSQKQFAKCTSVACITTQCITLADRVLACLTALRPEANATHAHHAEAFRSFPHPKRNFIID
jgi:hypothetical protein